MPVSVHSVIATNLATTGFYRNVSRRRIGSSSVNCSVETRETDRWAKLKNGNDSLEICRVLNGMWQTSGGWGKIDRNDAVEAMLRYADAGLSTFDMADHYGPAEDLYGIFVNRVRRERPPEYLEKIKGLTKWVPPPVKMTSSYVRQNIDISRKRMDVASLDMLQFHWWDYANDGYLDALKHLTDLKEEGKIKTVALTNFDTKRLEIILENGIPVVSNQVQHSIVDMRPQQRMAQLCELTGVKLITYGTVMGGLLSEKFLDANLTIPFAGPSLNTPSLQKYKRMVDAWGGWSLFQGLLRTMKSIATKHGVSIPTVAVRYVLDQQGVGGSMIGVRLGLAEHIQDANAIFSLVLDDEDVNSIKEATKKGKNLLQMVDAWGGWSLFQGLLRTMKSIATKHGVSIPTVAVRYVLDQQGVGGSMIGVRLGLAEHIQDANAIFSLVLDDEDVNSIKEATKKGKNLLQVIGDCGDEYRRV
ncbi:hypothetical protein F2Q69_00012315 [Brassica cretica]|uniref:NADP-dependent oxidoreductase domain-containing protein n=1 Tax=Brassica cretica TaxID=69181 RepID=A0A8S9R5G9_BRACR|nr:hypothetical protein F2Q69_00012315 [Brassica cretica]